MLISRQLTPLSITSPRQPCSLVAVVRDEEAVGSKALDASKAALAQRMHASGEGASTIAATLGVSRATGYRVLAEQADDAE
jgi:DNA invertase Pin-like site-specific DNA recombinase